MIIPQTPLAGFGAFFALFVAWLRVLTSTGGLFFELEVGCDDLFLGLLLEVLMFFFEALLDLPPLSFLVLLSFFNLTVIDFFGIFAGSVSLLVSP